MAHELGRPELRPRQGVVRISVSGQRSGDDASRGQVVHAAHCDSNDRTDGLRDRDYILGVVGKDGVAPDDDGPLLVYAQRDHCHRHGGAALACLSLPGPPLGMVQDRDGRFKVAGEELHPDNVSESRAEDALA